MTRSMTQRLILLALLLISGDLTAAGAIAIDERGRRESMATNLPSQRQADREALHACGHHCRIVGRFSNSCAAIAWPKHGGAWVWSEGFRSKNAAVNAVARRCRQETGGHACRVQAQCDGPSGHATPRHHPHGYR
ncbi:MAG: DUF4189 domain-containing protein [Magnetococcales bacterium]|nr:DUF4189 domain-containing protein [Magnetococcales bacterium]